MRWFSTMAGEQGGTALHLLSSRRTMLCSARSFPNADGSVDAGKHGSVVDSEDNIHGI